MPSSPRPGSPREKSAALSQLTPEFLEDCRAKLGRFLAPTPLLFQEQLNERFGFSLWLKAECMQPVGAFKARGAINTLLSLSNQDLSRGVCTYSSGNHAQAVAWAAQKRKLAATIFMPTNAPEIKVQKTLALGAKVLRAGRTSLERQAACYEFRDQNNSYVVEPFDSPLTIAGQASVGSELIAQLEDIASLEGAKPVLDQLYLPIGGGGLAAGTCLALAEGSTEIIGVEPEGCHSMHQSLAADCIVEVTPNDTIADGLKPSRVGKLPFEICRRRLAKVSLVSDREIRGALRILALEYKVIVEPSGAAAMAAAMREAKAGSHVGVILSGGNIDPSLLATIIEEG